MKTRTSTTRCPLTWPKGWARTPANERRWSRFGRRYGATLTVYSASQDVLGELSRLGAHLPIISTNLKVRSDGIPYSDQKRPADPGVAVWFELNGHERVLACDRWLGVEENLRAIACHVEALRGIDRWGVGNIEQAFSGFTALPENAGGTPWWEVLGVDPLDDRDAIERAFKRLAHERHPDKGGSFEDWIELQEARAVALAARPG